MKDKTVLLIDDNEADRFLNEITIEKFDPSIKVFSVIDGEQAMETLFKLEVLPDVILLDINMPGVDGFEFLEAYDKQANFKAPVVMLSSSEQGRDMSKAMSYKCVSTYFSMPLDFEDMKFIEKLCA